MTTFAPKTRGGTRPPSRYWCGGMPIYWIHGFNDVKYFIGFFRMLAPPIKYFEILLILITPFFKFTKKFIKRFADTLIANETNAIQMSASRYPSEIPDIITTIRYKDQSGFICSA